MLEQFYPILPTIPFIPRKITQKANIEKINNLHCWGFSFVLIATWR